MTDPYHQLPADAAANPAAPARSAEEQLAHEAAIGRAVMMVQRMEEDARERIRLQAEAELTRAQHDADTLVAEARQRATEVAEITRSAVARVLAEEHVELLNGLAELNAVEQRLRAAVTRTQTRVTAALGGTIIPGPADVGAAPAAAAPTAPVGDPAAPPTVSPWVPPAAEPAPAPSPVAPPVPPRPPVVPAPVPQPGDHGLQAEFARGPVGSDDDYIAELREAIDGQSAIAGRGATSAAGVAPVAPFVVTPPAPPAPPVPPVPPVPQPAPRGSGTAAPAPFAAAAAAAVAATATMPHVTPVPEPVVAPAPTLRVVPPVPPMPVTAPVAPGVEVPPRPPTEPEPAEAPSGERAARRDRDRAKRSKWARVGTVLRNVGILLLLFVAFQLWGTAALEHRDQSRLRHDFTLALAAHSSPASVANPNANGGDPSTVSTPTTAPVAPAAPTGEAVAVIKIPKIGVEQAVVEGTGVSDLRKGPGHYRNTPLPGQPGNAAIAGHRTTYGAPFNRIDELGPGDKILVTTLQGKFTYVVSEAPVAVSPSQNDVLYNKGDNRLTLTTCHPKYSAAKRLIVVAKLAKDAKPAPVSKATGGVKTVRVGEDAAASGDVGALLPALLWGMAAALAYAGMVWLSRRWIRRAALLLGVPIVLALLFPFFEQLSRLLPANY